MSAAASEVDADGHDTMMDTAEQDDYGLSQSAPGGESSRSSRLARKAESARQARLRHKQFVNDLQAQVDAAQERVRQLESFCASGPGSAAGAVRELQEALTPAQLQQLRQWLTEAQGESHVLARYERGVTLPPPPPPLASPPPASSGSSSIAIPGNRGQRRTNDVVSPMESDDDTTFPISRSWDDIEGARSILNLNSPNGFHPMTGMGSMLGGGSFSLPTAASRPVGPRPGGFFGAKTPS
ncbi:hypothetical protein AB1Y20_007918 [Prymnesium parvum]|uniref:BZIP domain-containing protein n=1 Tax=Prymnesium parvum TaxID=97485 RepID=A0AB34IS89_PRYPA